MKKLPLRDAAGYLGALSIIGLSCILYKNAYMYISEGIKIQGLGSGKQAFS